MTRIARRIWSAAASVAVAWWMSVPVLLAQQGRVNEFQAASPNDPGIEHLPATPLVFGAYAFVWVALLVYVFMLWRRLGRVERDLADVTARLNAEASRR